jgi:acetylornithine deacetylase/succinyl-diaminopimelate desuccinylase-like protein
MFTDSAALTQKRVSLDTINSPGNEAAATRLLGEMLAPAGVAVSYHEMAPYRLDLLAELWR